MNGVPYRKQKYGINLIAKKCFLQLKARNGEYERKQRKDSVKRSFLQDAKI